MPVQESHDLREYHIFTEPVVISAAATVLWVPIPEAGYLVRVRAIETAAITTGSAAITFENDTVACSGSLTIPLTGAAINRTTVADLTPNSPLNFFYEAETGDLVAKSGLIEVVSGGTGGAGTARFVFTIRP
jgi:hypothetical protein